MRRTARAWMYRIVPLLIGGVVVLMLLPAPPPAERVDSIRPASAAEMHLAALIAPPQPPAAPEMPAATLAKEDLTPAAASPAWPRLDSTASAAATGVVPPGLKSGQVGASALNVRAGPASSTGKLFVLAAGEAVKLGETSGGWVKVYRGDGESGWVFSRYIVGADQPATTVTASATPPAAATRAAQSSAQDDLRGRYARIGGPMPLRAAPDRGAPTLFLLDAGERVRIAQSRGGWIQVVTADGESGWIPT